MKRKFLKGLLLIVATILLVFTLSACFGSKDKNKDTEKTTKVDLTADMVTITGNHDYTGEPVMIDAKNISIIANGKNIVLDSVSLSYENNVEVGQATLIVTAKSDNKYIKGSARVPFEITPVTETTTTTTQEEFFAKVNDKNYEAVRAACDITVEKNTTFEIKGKKRIYMDTKTVDGRETGVTLINEGIIVIGSDAQFYFGGRRDYSFTLINRGKIVIDGAFNNLYGSRLYNGGDVQGKIKNYGAVYTNAEVEFEQAGSGAYYKRTEITKNSITFEKETVRYQADTEKNKLRAYVDNKYFGNATYTAYDKVGTVTVTCEATETDEYFFGKAENTYEIIKGAISVNTEDALVAAQETGNYNEYKINAYEGLTLQRDFTIGENEAVVCTDDLTINGTLKNYGDFTLQGRVYASLRLNGSVINYGSFTVEKAIVQGDGSFENKENAVATVWRWNVSGKLSNYGAVTYEENDNITNFSEVENHGEITSYGLSASKITNYGTLTVNSSLNISGDGYDGKETALLICKGASHIYCAAFTNVGKVQNDGKMAVSDACVFTTAENSFTNTNGELWIYEIPTTVTENVYLRRNLTDESLTVELEYDTVTYDELSHKPNVLIDGEIFVIPSGVRGVTCSYAYESGAADESFKRVGDILVTVKSTNEFYPYYGEIELRYGITYASASVSTAEDLTSKLNNANYNEIYLTSDVTVSKSITLGAGRTLFTNGYRLFVTSNSKLTVRGTLVISEIEEKKGLGACGLILLCTDERKTPTLSLGGKAVNDGIVYIDPNGASLSVVTGGELENNGKIYTYDDSLFTTTGEGQLFVRELLSAPNKYALSLSYENVTYDGEEKTPELVVKEGEETLDASAFEVSYENNTDAGEATVTVAVNNLLDENFAGETTLRFTIDRAVCPIEQDALDNGFFETYPAKNYKKYVLERNVELSENVTVPENVVFDVQNKNLVTKPGSVQYVLTLGENSKLLVSVATLASLQRYMFVADEITLIANINAPDETLSFNFTDNMTSDEFAGFDPYSVCVDFNGFSYSGAISVYTNTRNQVDFTLKNSSETKSTLGTAGGKYAVVQSAQSEINNDVNINMYGLKAYGLSLTGGGDKYFTMNAENCDFEQSGTKNALRLDKYRHIYRTKMNFTNCSFLAEDTAAYIKGGEDTFINCSFRSTGAYNERNHTGNGVTVHQTGSSNGQDAYVFNASFVGCSFTSANGYGVEKYVEKGSDTTTVTLSGTTTNAALGNKLN